MIVDKNYKGIIDCGSYFKIEGNLIADVLYITVSLFVVGDISSEGSIYMMGIKTTHLMIINSNLGYKIWVMDTHIKIGCKFYSKNNWIKFSESEIGNMDYNAKKRWDENKELLTMLCTLWNNKQKRDYKGRFLKR